MKKAQSILTKAILCVSFFNFPFSTFHSAQAQQVQQGDRLWDGAICYTATKYSNNAVELNGKDVNGDDYSINLIWMADQNEYSVFSRNGAIALRIDESARVKRFIRKGSRDFLVFYNAKGDAAWTMEFYINGELQGFTNMERKLEQRPASEVITSEVLNTTWLACSFHICPVANPPRTLISRFLVAMVNRFGRGSQIRTALSIFRTFRTMNTGTKKNRSQSLHGKTTMYLLSHIMPKANKQPNFQSSISAGHTHRTQRHCGHSYFQTVEFIARAKR